MDRRKFLQHSLTATAALPLHNPALSIFSLDRDGPTVENTAVLIVDSDLASAPIDKHLYGQFLEHINHSVEDGLFAEQIRGAGFEGTDLQNYWKTFEEKGEISLADETFHNGKRALLMRASGGRAGIRQGRIFIDQRVRYDGFVWIRRERGNPRLLLRLLDSKGEPLDSVTLKVQRDGWHEVPFSMQSKIREEQATIEIALTGDGTLLLDFVSFMRADARQDGMLRRDLLESLRQLEPSFIRWPGGSYASTYRWKECVGPYASRGYHPNMYWGGYSGYGGFGTDEFLGLCTKLQCDALIVLACPDTKPDTIQYAMDWVHYLNDPSDTPMGKLRAAHGHAEPYGVRYFQIDNEPMNNGFSAEAYAEIVNAYGSRLRQEAPHARIVACGQKRSSDMVWSEKIIDLAGDHFDILGCHNYEYEPDHYEVGLHRLREYLTSLCAYVRVSKHPKIEVAVLEWSLQHTYDWRAGLHAAGSLLLYERLGSQLTMTCPALLMRNTTDDPTWTSSIYHNHVTWFPGASHPVQKLFREHYAERYLASSTGSFHKIPGREELLAKLSTAIPGEWHPGIVDAVATISDDSRRIVIKAVNYQAEANVLLIQLEGKAMQRAGTIEAHTITSGLTQIASFEHPDVFKPVVRSLPFERQVAFTMDPYSVAVLEIRLA